MDRSGLKIARVEMKGAITMNTRDSEKLIPGSLAAFITLCIVWFLEFTGLLGGLFQGM